CTASSKTSTPSCNSKSTVDCGTGYCYTATYTQKDGTTVVDRNCNNPLDSYCPNAAKTCDAKTQAAGLKSCRGACCTTDNCNDYTLGSTLKCNQCTASSKTSTPSCNSKSTVDCGTGYCYTATYTQKDGTTVVDRNCNNPLDSYCPNAAKTCDAKTQAKGLKSCRGACCTTDNCNDYTLGNSASGVMVTKFILCFMVIAGFLFA
ncbi:Hypothetical predicted protein, partial [Paramuricea clavata]